MSAPDQTTTSQKPFTISSMISIDVEDPSLPFGPPPARLVELEMDGKKLPRTVLDQIQTLVGNAKDVSGSDSEVAALSWHEAGGLLDRTAGRKADAWRCYNMALVEEPKYKRSVSALRRLARLTEDTELRVRIALESIEVAEEPREQAGLHTQLGILHLRGGARDEAVRALSNAEAASPKGVTASLINAAAAAFHGDLSDVHHALHTLLETEFSSEMRDQVQLVTALLEEGMGDPDSALETLGRRKIDGAYGSAAMWAKLRLLLRLRMVKEALEVSQELREHIDDETEKGAFERIALLLSSLLSDDGKPGSLLEAVTDDRIGDAARVLEVLDGNTEFDEASGVGSPLVLAAAAAYLGIEEKDESSGADSPAMQGVSAVAIHEADLSEDWETLGSLYAKLREQCSEERDRWSISVAEAFIGIERRKQPGDALAMLLAETDRLNRAPLPALVRAYDDNEGNLAELAIAEAEDGDYDEFKAWRFAWAAHHLEEVDKNEAGRLYLRALSLFPSMLFAISGLSRTVSDRTVLSEAYANASEAASDPHERFQALIRAALQMVADGNGLRAAEILGDAFEYSPNDESMRRAVSVLARSHPETAAIDFIEPFDEYYKLDRLDLISLGFLALGLHPRVAVGWFEKAHAMAPGDPVVQFGLDSALLRTGDLDRLKGEIKDLLLEPDSTEEEIFNLLRLAAVQRRLNDTKVELLETLDNIGVLLPGYRTPIAWSITERLYQNRTDELPGYYEELAKTIEDPASAVALAQAAWHIGGDRADLLRYIVIKESTAYLEMARLATLTEDLGERRALFEKLVSAGNLRIHRSRLAEVWRDLDDGEKATALYRGIVEEDADSILELTNLSVHYRTREEYEPLVDVLRKLADAFSLKEYKKAYLTEAIEVALSDLLDQNLTAGLCLDVLRLDPKDENAYKVGKEVLSTAGDDPISDEQTGMLLDLMELRLSGIQEDADRRVVHLDLAGAFVSRGGKDDRVKAKKHLGGALEIDKKDVENHFWLARLYREDEEWNDSVNHLISAARFVKRATPGMDIFLAMGEIYMDHTDRLDLAEKAFLKVINWDNTHEQALVRISKLYYQIGNPERSAKALAHLIGFTEDDDKKVARLIELAEIEHEQLKKSKQAEHLLVEANRIKPLAFEPIEALAALYRRDGDPVALKVHLDSAVATLASMLIDDPDNRAIYENLIRVSSLKDDDTVGAFATEILSIIRPSLAKNRKPQTWDLGVRGVNPEYMGYLSPKVVSAGFQETLRAIEPFVAELMGVSGKDLKLEKGERLGRRDTLYVLLQEMSKLFRIPTPQAYAVAEGPLRIHVGSPPVVVFPDAVRDADEAAMRFCIGMALQMTRLGLTLVTCLDDEDLLDILSAATGLMDSRYHSTRNITTLKTKLKEVIPENVLMQLMPFSGPCQEALNIADLPAYIRNVGHRFGFMCAGNLEGAFDGLKLVSAKHSDRLANVEGLGLLTAFVFSSDHIQVRKRMGL